MKRANGVVLWKGQSLLNGDLIVLVATGLNAPQRQNEKTGHMIQTWILCDDVSPIEASRTGADERICGGCPHRGVANGAVAVGRTCYVQLWSGVRNVWLAYKRGTYHLNKTDAPFRGLGVRVGSYGDPAAVPVEVWQRALHKAAFSTGYTHQWRSRPDLKSFCMASTDSDEEREEARVMGWRTFRVGENPRAGEVVCPASEEAGYKATCNVCRACGGVGAKARADIVIAPHGNGKRLSLSQQPRLFAGGL
jgi:hypothetical protein